MWPSRKTVPIVSGRAKLRANVPARVKVVTNVAQHTTI